MSRFPQRPDLHPAGLYLSLGTGEIVACQIKMTTPQKSLSDATEIQINIYFSATYKEQAAFIVSMTTNAYDGCKQRLTYHEEKSPTA
jgi:fibronectin type 3 domain-containing protein